jgi:hypothetical protein
MVNFETLQSWIMVDLEAIVSCGLVDLEAFASWILTGHRFT